MENQIELKEECPNCKADMKYNPPINRPGFYSCNCSADMWVIRQGKLAKF